MKDIVKMVHLPSVVQSECYEATRILFVRKENKNYDFYSTICLLHVTVAPFWRISAGRKLRTLFCVSLTTRMQFVSSGYELNEYELNWKIHIKMLRVIMCQINQLSEIYQIFWLFFLKKDKHKLLWKPKY